MTREEEIMQEANARYSVSHPFVDIAKDSFIEGAKWADETMIEKACNWLLHQEEMIGISFENDFIERFKKAMKEE